MQSSFPSILAILQDYKDWLRLGVDYDVAELC